jgi:hypothetical protein
MNQSLFLFSGIFKESNQLNQALSIFFKQFLMLEFTHNSVSKLDLYLITFLQHEKVLHYILEES